MNALKQLCANLGVQVVFSTTEYHYSGDGNDAEWNPPFPGPGEDQKMFLKLTRLDA